MKLTAVFLSFILGIFSIFGTPVYANSDGFAVESDAKSLILIEANTGTVLYEKDADMPLPPASVTKVMTMLLIMEAVDSGKISLEDTVSVSENASKMGGSQVYLKAGE